MKELKNYWRDVWHSFSSSKGRVISIVALMSLGSFALVGLNVSAPDIRTTGENFFKTYNTADVYVLSDYGLDHSDRKIIDELSNKAKIEYGYFSDTTIEGTNKSVRIFSKPENISKYKLTSGKLPNKENEIVLSSSYDKKYKIGEKIQFENKNSDDTTNILKIHQYTITGFVNSSEILSNVNLGESSSGTGNLEGYAVVPESAFDSSVYMVARISYDNLRSLSPYSDEYINEVNKNKDTLEEKLKNQPQVRLDEIKEVESQKINNGYKAIESAQIQLSNGSNLLLESREKINSSENEISQKEQILTNFSGQLNIFEQNLVQGKDKLDSSNSELKKAKEQIKQGSDRLLSSKKAMMEGQSQINLSEANFNESGKLLSDKEKQISELEIQLNNKTNLLTQTEKELENEEVLLKQSKNTIDNYENQIKFYEINIAEAEKKLANEYSQAEINELDPETLSSIIELKHDILQMKSELSVYQKKYDNEIDKYNSNAAIFSEKRNSYNKEIDELSKNKIQLSTKKEEYQDALSSYNVASKTLESKKIEYEENLKKYNGEYEKYSNSESEYIARQKIYENGLSEYNSNLAIYQEKCRDLINSKEAIKLGKQSIEKANKQLTQKQSDFDAQKQITEQQIEDSDKKLKSAQAELSNLSHPTYLVDSRREVPGSDGYLSYENTASIIDSVSSIFPIILYFVASLVTFTTMRRFVDEERLKNGTFKALGYSNKEILQKFIVYSSITGLIGTLIGTLLGHTLLPLIIDSSYNSKIILNPIELHFYPWQTALAILLGLISTVFPAILAVKKELKESPSQLLLPKPPVDGSTILLERITPLWKKMSFTHKVTARNIFRYKQRMFMTIFGVCGSVSLLFAGLGIQSSITELNNRQFSDIIKYDMIVANSSKLNEAQKNDINKELGKNDIKSSMPIHYETLSKVAGDKKDKQAITLLVPEKNNSEFKNYINLVNRKTTDELPLTNKGAVISEKLANLLNTKVGDTITVKDSENKEIKIKVSGISEMYMNHFIFMNEQYYNEVFDKKVENNANLVLLQNNSISNTEKISSNFMKLDGVTGVVQNTTIKTQVDTIVSSISRIMYILIIVSVLLTIVILYNLTNINIAERIRELSTIKVLGFYDKEVTLYIYRETILLSGVGILVGFLLGYLLENYMIRVIPPDNVMFNPGINITTYIIPFILVTIVLIILGIVVNQWLKKVDMLEALKSVE